jgi:carbamoyltransferase
LIVVGFGKARHDCNISIYDDGKFTYIKKERETNLKHDNADDFWFWNKLKENNINHIDLLVETHQGFWCKSLPRLPYNNEILQLNEKNTHLLIDHHLAHAYSHTKFNQNKTCLVVDGRGSNNYTSSFYTKDKPPLKFNDRIGQEYNFMSSWVLADQHKEILDMAGKFMGLIAYEESYRLWNDYMYSKLKKMFSVKELFYMGGCALNVDWNSRLEKDNIKIDVEPHCYDGGLSIGCVRFGLEQLNILDNFKIEGFPYIQSDEKPKKTPSTKTIDKVADYLAKGKIVGWYQGNGEVGPRALGNRSILMRPDIKNGKELINNKVKKRESFRPYGASILEEESSNYFEKTISPYMLYSSKILQDKLDPITHIDNTCRHQTVNYEQNNFYYELLQAFYRKTGLPLLLNTSLNTNGDPICGTIEEAKNIFKKTDMDAICIGDSIYRKD